MKDILLFLKKISSLDWLFIGIYLTTITLLCVDGHIDAAAWVFAVGYTYITPQYYKYMKEIENEKFKK